MLLKKIKTLNAFRWNGEYFRVLAKRPQGILCARKKTGEHIYFDKNDDVEPVEINYYRCSSAT